MAIYDLGTASLSANGEVTGVGTKWKAPLTLIRVGATIVFKTEPVQIYTISEIISDTQINVYNPNSETVTAGTGYAILAHDGITVQGLAQDVAETLRYYQGKETEISGAVDIFNSFDWEEFQGTAIKVEQDAASAEASKNAAKQSEDNAGSSAAAALASQNAAKTSETNAKTSETNAKQSEINAEQWAQSVNPGNLLTKTDNLAGLADKSSARSNLGLGSVATENTVPIEKGGTAATTAAAARANLGVGDDSLVKLGALHLNGGESVVLNALEANSTSLSNALYGVNNWVGHTMHRWYDDWTRAGIVRADSTHLSDYRIHVWKNGQSEALFRFMPDQRLISGYTGNPSVNEFQKAPLSDRDLKKEIQYTDGEESYNRVRQWRPAMFKYKDSDVQRYGLIAQDLAMIDPEYVHLLPGHAIYEDIKGVDEEGNEVVVDQKEIGYTDDVLSLDSNVLLMDICAAFVYNSNKVSDLEKEVEELKAIVSDLNSK